MQISKKIISSLSVLALIAMTGCEDKGKTEVKEITQEVAKEVKEKTHTQGEIDMHGGKNPPPLATSKIVEQNGTVLEVLDASPYTYLSIETDSGAVWVAVPKVNVNVGAKVSFIENMRVANFESTTLNRKFDTVIFVNAIKADSPIQKASPHNPHAHLEKNETKEDVATPTIAPITDTVDGGFRVEEIYAKKADLKDKTIKVIGKVVKVSPAIMGKNWVHIQDGTGSGRTSDLIFTSVTELPTVGDEVIAEGKLVVDKDFGYGYFYEVIVEESTFSKK